MKKRLLSLVLCLVMVFSLFPTFASATVHPVDDSVHALDVVFKNGSTTISTQSVFKQTNVDLPKDAIYDPGCPLEAGTMFLGWQIEGTTDLVTVEEVLAYVNQHNSGVTVNAVTSAVHYLVYKDENNRVLKTDTVAQTEHPDWNVTVDYDYVPAVSNQDHVGWTTTKDSDTVNYYNGETINVSAARVELYPVCKAGFWLSFDANIGQDDDPTKATFTAPKLYVEDQNTQAPTAPTRPGYTLEGWYTDQNLTQKYTFGQPLSDDMTLYAKWNPAQTTYQVIFWKQKTTDSVDAADAEKTYDYCAALSETRNATTGASVSITTADTQMARAATPNITSGTNEKWNFFNYNATNTDTDPVTVKGDGSTVLNVYYDRQPITIEFTNRSGGGWGSDYTYTLYYDNELVDGRPTYTYTDNWETGYYMIGEDGPKGAEYFPTAGTTVYSFNDLRKSSLTSDYIGEYFTYTADSPDASNTYNPSETNRFYTSGNNLYHLHNYWLAERYFAQFYYYENQSGTYYEGEGPEADITHGDAQTSGTHYYYNDTSTASGYYRVGLSNGPRGNWTPSNGDTIYAAKYPEWRNWNNTQNNPRNGTNYAYISESDATGDYAMREFTYNTAYVNGNKDDYSYGPTDPVEGYRYNFHWNTSNNQLYLYARIEDGGHKYRAAYYYHKNLSGWYEVGKGPDPTAPGTATIRNSSYTGLYGAEFKDWIRYDRDGNEIEWGLVGSSNSYPMPVLMFDNFDEGEASSGQASKMTLYYSTTTSGRTIHYQGQTLEGGDNYEDFITFKSGGRWYPTEQFVGFTIKEYRNGTSGSWTAITPNGSIPSSSSEGYVHFTRNQHHFVMTSNGTDLVNDMTYYEAPLAKYSTMDYVPDNGPDGAYFDGWYADPGFTEPFNFNTTMPDNDVRVYAKWPPQGRRGVLEPTGGDNSVADQISFPGNQVTAFRVDYGEKIEKNAIQAATRNSNDGKTWQLVGWYSDPNFEHPFNFNFAEWDQIADFDYDAAPDAQRQGDDFWNKENGTPKHWSDVGMDDVVGKVTLYAKWRQLMNADDFIKVKYDGNGGDNEPLDDTAYYADMSQAIAQPATTKQGENFRAWLILDKNGNTIDEVRPGGTFNVEFDNAVQSADDPHEYDVWLKADYSAPAGAVEIPWFANYNGATVELAYAQPFAATNVHAAPTNPDGEFLGWARVNKPDTYDVRNLTESDLWLVWDGSQYKVNNKVVTQIYSDLDITQNQALYAVWENYETNDVKLMDYGVTGTVATGVKADSLKSDYAGFVLSNGTLTFKYIPNDTSFDSSSSGNIVGWNYDYTGIAGAKTATYRDADNKLHKVTVVAASSAYFDDDLNGATKTALDGSGVLNSEIAQNAKDTDGTNITRITINFIGTGIDVYCTSASDSGRVSYKLDGVGGVMVNKNGAEGATYYNAPTIRKLGLDYGPHELVITCGAAAKYKLDGIRIYGATEDTNQATELKAVYQNLRTILQEAGAVPSEEVAGAVFVPGGEAADKGYKDGTINEIMLSSGQGVAFQVDGMATADKMYVGLASATGAEVKVTVSYGDGVVQAYSFSNTIHTFYEVKTTGSGYVYIKNTGDNLVSVTDLKIVPTAMREFSFKANAPLMRYVESFSALPQVSEIVEPTPEPSPLPSEEPEPSPSADPEPGPSAEPDPTPTTSITSIIRQLISSFVQSLFGSVSRLFGRP